MGREREVELLLDLLSRTRLTTLVGPPGIGKSRLAREVALRIADRFPGGAWLCDASGAEDARELVALVGRTVGARSADDESEESSAARVAAAIERRGRAILVLDELERIERAGALVVARWIEAAPDAVFLATSRAPLRVQAEHRLELWGLSANDGGALFVDRAIALRPAHPLDDAELASARRIAERLDGNPLAIELAAGRSTLLSATEIEARLEGGADLLRGGARDAPARHASLREALEVSLRMLGAAERDALVQCTVFRSGFTASEAEAVIDLSGNRDAPPVLAALEMLRERSLLAPHDNGGPRRFRLLATIQQHLAGELDDDTRRRHAQHVLARFEAHGADLSGEMRGDRAATLEAAERELSDALSAFRWALAADFVLAARLAIALDEVLRITGPFPVRAEVLEDALRVLPSDPALAAKLRLARGVARLDAGRYPGATEDLEEAASIAARIGHRGLLARAGLQLGNVSLWQGHWDDARARYENALATSREAGTPLVTAKLSNNLALIASGRGALEEARRLYAEALETGGRADDHYAGNALVNLAQLHHQAGDLARARIDFDEAQRLLAKAGARFYECFACVARGWLSVEQHDLRGADEDLARARALLDAMGGDARLEGLILATEGVLAAARDRPDAAAATLRDARAVLIGVGDRGCLDALEALEGFLDLARARAAGREDVAEAYADGARARLDHLARRDAAGEVLLSETRVPMRLLEWALADHRRGASGSPRLEVGRDAQWFRFGGETLDLSRRRTLRRLFAGLVERRLAEPGRAIPQDELVEIAWPGERMTPLSASRRVYVSIHTLRRLGLEDVLVTSDEGYLLDPDVPVVLIE